MNRSLKLILAFVAVAFAAAFMSNIAAAGSQPLLSTAPSYSDENAGPVLKQLAGTIEITIGNKKKKKLKLKTKGCPAGQNRDPNTGVCFSCSHNDHFENGECVPCMVGFHEEGEECVPNVKKKKKTSTKKKTCPEGQNADPNSGVCFSCSHNDHFDAAQGQCVPCKQGFHVEGDECVAD